MYHFHCGPLGLSGDCCLCGGGCLGFLVRSISNSGLIMCDSARRKQVEAGMKGREGGGLLYSDRPSPPPDIMEESIDAVLCTFSADPARRGVYSASCLWHGSQSLSLAHSVTIIPPTSSCPHASCHCKHTHTGRFVHTHTLKPSPSSKMHLSPVVLWHWTVC